MRTFCRLAVALCFFAVVGCTDALPPRPTSGYGAYPDTLDLPFRSFGLLRTADWRDTTTFNAHAVVTQLEPCPPCPADAICEPCSREWLAAYVAPPPNTALGGEWLLIDVDNVLQLRTEQDYALSLQPYFAFTTVGDTLVHYTLLGYTPLSLE